MNLYSKLEALNGNQWWFETLVTISESKGFSYLLILLGRTRHEPLDHAFHRTNFPDEWWGRYINDKLYEKDPSVSHCMGSSIPYIWGMSEKPVGDCVISQAASFGLRSGLSLPIHGPRGESGLLSFASPSFLSQDLVQSMLYELPSLSMIRDSAAASACEHLAKDMRAPHLTPRELDTLSWISLGKSNWEIARILKCSEPTVSFHVSNLLRKLDSRNRSQALGKALSLGVLPPLAE